MQKKTYEEYLALRKGAKVIERDSFGDKVLLLPDNTYLKLFRRKRLFSSATIYPYAKRFVNNAEKLQRLGIACPQILSIFRVSSISRDAVHYAPLPGHTLRQLHQSKNHKNYSADLLPQFVQFVEKIWDQGVYFRSMHLNNVVLTPDGDIGLIDIADMKIRRRALTAQHKRRNMRHIMRDAKDKAWLKQEAFFNVSSYGPKNKRPSGFFH